jgi:predicted O-methyltransferase YrrM
MGKIFGEKEIMTDYPNWFQRGRADVYFNRNLLPYTGQYMKCLQLGAYTGDATEWMFDNVLSHPESTLLDVDTWAGSDEPEHKNLDWKSVEDRYLERHQKHIDSGKLSRYKGMTDEFFASPEGQQTFDFIYVDADHQAASVLKDGLNSFYRLNIGGFLVFDDYMWTQGKGLWADPKPAVNAILECFSNKITVLDSGLQVWLKKTAE